jgi:hypothetical protein
MEQKTRVFLLNDAQDFDIMEIFAEEHIMIFLSSGTVFTFVYKSGGRVLGEHVLHRKHSTNTELYPNRHPAKTSSTVLADEQSFCSKSMEKLHQEIIKKTI